MSLDLAPAFFRSTVSRRPPGRVDRDRMVIERFSVITQGEALGHGLWIDAEFLSSLVDLGNEFGSRGVKSRFTHPGLSSDGLGKALGRSKRFNLAEGQVYADLYLLRAASKSPDGDLPTYVMELAEEDPEVFGASIVFSRDVEGEQVFLDQHSPEGRFQSPDPRNTKNLPHARLGRLIAVDVVDTPAANPGGFFSAGQEAAATAEVALSYLLGLSDKAPSAETTFGIHPDRARQFVGRFFQTRGLELRSKEASVSDPTPATLAELKSAFGDRPDFVLEQLEAGATLEQAKTRYLEVMLAEAKQSQAETEAALSQAFEELEQAKKAAEKAAPAPAPVAAPKGEKPLAAGDVEDEGPRDFLAEAKARATELGISNTEAMRRLAREDNAGHRAWVANNRHAKARKA